MNNCNFIGRIGKDAVVRHTAAGKAVAGWSIAVDVGYGDNKQTLWIDCALWGERATKLADYIRKGDRIGVHGELGTREHDGKTYVTLRVADVTLLGEKRDGANQQRDSGPSAREYADRRNKPVPASPPADSQFADDFEGDPIPF